MALSLASWSHPDARIIHAVDLDAVEEDLLRSPSDGAAHVIDSTIYELAELGLAQL